MNIRFRGGGLGMEKLKIEIFFIQEQISGMRSLAVCRFKFTESLRKV